MADPLVPEEEEAVAVVLASRPWILTGFWRELSTLGAPVPCLSFCTDTNLQGPVLASFYCEFFRYVHFKKLGNSVGPAVWDRLVTWHSFLPSTCYESAVVLAINPCLYCSKSSSSVSNLN